jgi:hypothetical protein
MRFDWNVDRTLKKPARYLNTTMCVVGRAMAQAVNRRPVTAAAWVRAQVNPVGFVVDKVALGQVFLRVLRFSPVNIIPPCAPLLRKLKKIYCFHSFTPSLILIWGRTKGP